MAAPFTITCISEIGEVYKLDYGTFEALVKKDPITMKALIANYNEKRHLLHRKKTNMHMDLKFGSNMEPTSAEKGEHSDDALSWKSGSPARSIENDKIEK